MEKKIQLREKQQAWQKYELMVKLVSKLPQQFDYRWQQKLRKKEMNRKEKGHTETQQARQKFA